MTAWEYFVAPLLEHNPGEILNTFGDDGWELVSVVAQPTPSGAVVDRRLPEAPEGPERCLSLRARSRRRRSAAAGARPRRGSPARGQDRRRRRRQPRVAPPATVVAADGGAPSPRAVGAPVAAGPIVEIASAVAT